MNRIELIQLLKSLNLPKDEYYILGGGSLLLCGLRETTKDLDLCVSSELFITLKDKYSLSEKDKNSCGFYKLTELIEVVPTPKENFKAQEVDGFLVESLETILAYKKKRNLPKDQIDIQNIEKFLNK
ncbi:MAG: hypothetical protein IKV94_05200 [Clostridia bacterium]|nr:hypothetical protein [Clostridia bacterium]